MYKNWFTKKRSMVKRNCKHQKWSARGDLPKKKVNKAVLKELIWYKQKLINATEKRAGKNQFDNPMHKHKTTDM